jgi:hypothetical protein
MQGPAFDAISDIVKNQEADDQVWFIRPAGVSLKEQQLRQNL